MSKNSLPYLLLLRKGPPLPIHGE